MGGATSAFSVRELEDYQELTFFTKREILHVHSRFSQLVAEEGNHIAENPRSVRLPAKSIMGMDELKVNPFKDRICKVFSSQDDNQLSFEDFLDMMSVFSDSCPQHVKVEYAFRIYDFDNDDKIGKKDLAQVINCLTLAQWPNTQRDKPLSNSEMGDLIKNILDEADLDGDEALSFAEFEHVISKAPDFVNSFTIRL